MLCTGCQNGCQKEGVCTEFLHLFLAESNGRPVLVLVLAQRAGVCWKVASRIIDEYYGGVVGSCVETVKKKSLSGLRIGLTSQHETFLLWLRFEDPFQTNEDYVNLFFCEFGIRLSKSFITHWFWDRFEKRGGSRRRKSSQLINSGQKILIHMNHFAPS